MNFLVIIVLIVASAIFIKSNFSQFKPPNQVRKVAIIFV